MQDLWPKRLLNGTKTLKTKTFAASALILIAAGAALAYFGGGRTIWYENQVSKGNVEAALKLRYLYEDKALKLYRNGSSDAAYYADRACMVLVPFAASNNDASFHLGLCQENPLFKGDPFDPILAREAYQYAADNGHEGAANLLRMRDRPKYFEDVHNLLATSLTEISEVRHHRCDDCTDEVNEIFHEVDRLCASHLLFAERVMRANQFHGASREAVLAITLVEFPSANGEPEYSQIVRSAFNYPIQNDDGAKKDVVERFSRQTALDCLQGFYDTAVVPTVSSPVKETLQK